MEIEGKRVLVTGASSGIGRETATAFLNAGAQVVAVARRAERLAQLRGVQAIPADLSEPGSAAKVAEQAGDIDILINNAGSEVAGSVWAVGDRPEARSMFEVDWWTPLALISALTPGMRERGEGAIVNMTSIRQVLAWPSLGHSAAAKAALAQLTETLRLELLDTGITVTEVVAGPVETAALGATRLLTGFVEHLHETLGTGTAPELAAQILHSVRTGQSHIYYPPKVEQATQLPADLRALVTDWVRQTPSLPDDTLVVGPGHPLVTEAKATWENTH